MKLQRTLTAFVVVLAVAAGAFGQAPAKGQKPAGAQSKTGARKALGSPADEAAVRALVREYQEAFNANDAAKAASIYAEDGVFVDTMGKAWQGRPEIQKEITGDNPGSRPRLTLNVEGVRFIKPDVAMMRGSSMVEGGDVPQGTGAGHWAVVAMKIGGQWKVVAATAAAHPPRQGRG